MKKIKTPKLYHRNCLICGKSNKRKFFQSDFFETFPNGDYFYKLNTYVLCSNCLFVYTNPDVSDYLREKIYSNLVIEDPNKNHEKSYRSKIHYQMFKELVDKKLLNSKSRLLEIGCGTGGLLKNVLNGYKLKKKNIFGIEISNILINYLKKNKFQVFKNLKEIKKYKNRFDFIILDNVFEHLDKPFKELKIIKTFLKKNGKIYCSIPNILKTRTNISDPLNHECNYLLSNFKYVFEKSGYKIEKFKYRYYWLNSLISKSTKNLKYFKFKTNKSLRQIQLLKNILKKNEIQNKFLYKKINKLKNKKILLYGAGNHALSFLFMFKKLNLNLIGISDSNKTYHGKKRFGYKIIDPNNIWKLKYDKIVISSRAFQDEIYKYLINLNIERKKIYTLY